MNQKNSKLILILKDIQKIMYFLDNCKIDYKSKDFENILVEYEPINLENSNAFVPNYGKKKSFFSDMKDIINVGIEVIGLVRNELKSSTLEKAIENINEILAINKSLNDELQKLGNSAIDQIKREVISKRYKPIDKNWLINEIRNNKTIQKDSEYLKLYDEFENLKIDYIKKYSYIESFVNIKIISFFEKFIFYFKNNNFEQSILSFISEIENKLNGNSYLYENILNDFSKYDNQLPQKNELSNMILNIKNHIIFFKELENIKINSDFKYINNIDDLDDYFLGKINAKKIRTYSIAKELNIEAKEVISKARELDIFLVSPESVLTFEESEKIKKNILNKFINLSEEKVNPINSNRRKLFSLSTENAELLELKQELKKLELIFQKLVEQKTEYLNDIEEFNNQHNLHLGELIRNILNLKKEILHKKTIKHQKIKEQFQKNKDICNETKQTINELKNTIVELEEILENIDEDNESYEEIKNAYDELKEELKNIEEQLLVEEQKLEKTEKKIEENEVIQEEYEEAKSNYEKFDNEYEHIKDTQKDVKKLNEEDKKELKLLYKKAAKLCHPDIVSDEFKEKAHEIMQLLNDAYSKKDINEVRKILLNLENGITFKTISNVINNKELLESKIKEFEKNIIDLEKEINIIKEDDTYKIISTLENWDDYFKELRTELQKEKDKLEDEDRRVLEEKEEVEEIEEEHLFEKNIQKEDSEYSKYILSIENVKFEKIRKYCENLLNHNQADEMQEYLAQNGKMYKALIYDSLEQFIEKLDGENITLIDWGCKQGIVSMLVLDYIKEKQLNINVDTVVLIDNKEKTLSRAMIQAESLDFSKAQIIPIYTNDNNYLDKIKTIQNGNTLNLYANDKILVNFSEINFDSFENAYFMCVSNENKKFVDEIYEPIKIFIDIQNMSIRDSKIGKYKKFERIFKISKEFDIEIDEIPF